MKLLLLVFAISASAAPWSMHVIDNNSHGADGVRLADANGDGFADIATGWEEGNSVRIALHPGLDKVREPWISLEVGPAKAPEDAVFADLDGNGILDVVSCSEGKTVRFHWAPERERYLDPKAWRTEPVVATQGKARWMFALPMQLDGKHGIDLVLGSKGPIGILASPADPRDAAAWTFRPIYQGAWIMSIIPVDVDGDGDQDLIASDRKGKKRGLLWLENPGPAGDWPEHRIGGADREPMFLAWDNGELLAAMRNDRIRRYRKPADPKAQWEFVEFAFPGSGKTHGTIKAVRAGDIGGDARPDIIITCEHADRDKSGVLAMIQTDAGWQHIDIGGPPGTKYDLIELVDVYRDGDLDIITCEERDRLGVIWYENPRSNP
jgi:hypothetical protein